jgi:uncharacterized membrane protein
MRKARRVWSDQRVEAIVGNLLRLGVSLAAGVVLLGGVLYLLHHGSVAPDYHVFRGEPTYLRGLGGIWRDARGFHSRGVIQLGLLLLIATPMARVAFSVFAFLRQRDWMYVVVTLIVLAVLVYSLATRHG